MGHSVGWRIFHCPARGSFLPVYSSSDPCTGCISVLRFSRVTAVATPSSNHWPVCMYGNVRPMPGQWCLAVMRCLLVPGEQARRWLLLCATRLFLEGAGCTLSDGAGGGRMQPGVHADVYIHTLLVGDLEMFWQIYLGFIAAFSESVK